MTTPNQKMLFWSPRILGILFTLFLSLFALDMFGTGEPWYRQMLGFVIHLIPQYILIVALLLAWRHEKTGGVLFLILYFAAIIFFRAELIEMILFAPLILIGALFLLHSRSMNGKQRRSVSYGQ